MYEKFYFMIDDLANSKAKLYYDKKLWIIKKVDNESITLMDVNDFDHRELLPKNIAISWIFKKVILIVSTLSLILRDIPKNIFRYEGMCVDDKKNVHVSDTLIKLCDNENNCESLYHSFPIYYFNRDDVVMDKDGHKVKILKDYRDICDYKDEDFKVKIAYMDRKNPYRKYSHYIDYISFIKKYHYVLYY